MEPYSDNEVMLLVRNGNLEKLGLLFERYKKPLFAYFFRLGRDLHASEDLVQNVFLRMLKYRHNFTGYGEFHIWMYQVAHNVFIDHCNRNNRYKAVDDFSGYDLAEEAIGDSEIVREEQLQLLEKALLQMHAEKRELLILCKYQQLKYKEIGEILGCSENNVKIKVFRALTELKDIYMQMDKCYEK